MVFPQLQCYEFNICPPPVKTEFMEDLKSFTMEFLFVVRFSDF